MPKPDRDLVEAAVDFGRAAALYRDAGETVAACRSTIQRGACLLKLGQTAQAVVAFGDALQIAAANHRSVERDDLDKLAELRRGALLHRGVTLASLALGSRSSCATALADAELAVELGDNASTLYLAAGIYALAAREAWQDPERMKELFHKRAERSLSLLARALEGSSPTTAEGARVRRFHAPASPSNPSPIFYALRNEPEYLRLVKIYCQPVRGDRDNTLRKVSASGERGMP